MGIHAIKCSQLKTMDTCGKDTANYCAWFPETSVCKSEIDAYCTDSRAGAVRPPAAVCKYAADVQAYCTPLKQSDCQAKKGCVYASATCKMSEDTFDGPLAALTIAKNAGSASAASVMKSLEQCTSQKTSAACTSVKVNSAVGQAQQVAVLLGALLMSLAAVMLF
jgi:hypothetical protein